MEEKWLFAVMKSNKRARKKKRREFQSKGRQNKKLCWCCRFILLFMRFMDGKWFKIRLNELKGEYRGEGAEKKRCNKSGITRAACKYFLQLFNLFSLRLFSCCSFFWIFVRLVVGFTRQSRVKHFFVDAVYEEEKSCTKKHNLRVSCISSSQSVGSFLSFCVFFLWYEKRVRNLFSFILCFIYFSLWCIYWFMCWCRGRYLFRFSNENVDFVWREKSESATPTWRWRLHELSKYIRLVVASFRWAVMV